MAALEDEQAALEARYARLEASFKRLGSEMVVVQAQRDHLQREQEKVHRSFVLRTLTRLQGLRQKGPKNVLEEMIANGRSASPIRVFLDHPLPRSKVPVSGLVYVCGWAFSRADPIERVEAYLGNERLGAIPHGLDRPDVSAAFPKLAQAGRCGYEHMFPVAEWQPGNYEFAVRVTDRAGNTESVQRSIVLVPPSESP